MITYLQLVSWKNISWSRRAASVTQGGWLISGARIDQLPWWLHTVCLLPGKSWALQGQIQRQPTDDWWWGIFRESITACGGIEICVKCEVHMAVEISIVIFWISYWIHNLYYLIRCLILVISFLALWTGCRWSMYTADEKFTKEREARFLCGYKSLCGSWLGDPGTWIRGM